MASGAVRAFNDGAVAEVWRRMTEGWQAPMIGEHAESIARRAVIERHGADALVLIELTPPERRPGYAYPFLRAYETGEEGYAEGSQ
jgi:hypothetical protein